VRRDRDEVRFIADQLARSRGNRVTAEKERRTAAQHFNHNARTAIGEELEIWAKMQSPRTGCEWSANTAFAGADVFDLKDRP